MQRKNNRGQIAIYVIVAIAVVGLILVFMWYRGGLNVSGVPAELTPAYNNYLSCVEAQTRAAIDIAGSQGGHIYVEDFTPGSNYAPFSSQLSYLGNPIQYWYYISGNGLQKENVPSIGNIEGEMARYIQERIEDCDFSSLIAEGYYLTLGSPKASVKINEGDVVVSVNQDLVIEKAGTKASKNSHSVDVKSSLGAFYNIAKQIYDKEKKELFFENYTEDILRTYAPVDGVDFNCAPRIWKTQEVVDKLQKGMVANAAAIKFNGNYYSLNNKKDNYFVVNLPQKLSGDTSVGVSYSQNWPSKIEIYAGGGLDNQLMVASPIGNQQGLGMMGFCYVPYHFVYDIAYPLLIQVYNQNEIFQFPVVVVIEKNKPRVAAAGSANTFEGTFDLCADASQEVAYSFYDVNLNPLSINATVSYSCFDQICNLGQANGAGFVAKLPSCVNGLTTIRAKGYAEKRQILSTNNENRADVILDKLYDANLSVKLNGAYYKGDAVVTFEGENSVSAVLPGNNKIRISEGLYNVSVYAYSNTSVVIPASTKNVCSNVPRQGIFGFLGATQEQCTNVNIPSTTISSGIIGGGKTSVYLFP